MSSVESRLDPVGIDQGYSRRNFLKTAGWATAAISAAGITGFGVAERYANAQNGGAPPYKSYEGVGDVGILSFAYLLEQLEGIFYQTGADAGIFSGNDLAQIAAIRDHEISHAEALMAVIQGEGAKVPATPNFTYPDGVFTDPTAFLKLAATFEPVGVGAYQGAAPALQNKDYLASALSIHNAEGMHIVAINILMGVVPPANMAFGEALPLPKVQEAVAPFGITG